VHDVSLPWLLWPDAIWTKLMDDSAEAAAAGWNDLRSIAR